MPTYAVYARPQDTLIMCVSPLDVIKLFLQPFGQGNGLSLWVRSIAGDKGCGSFGESRDCHNGVELTIAAALVNMVSNSSLLTSRLPKFNSVASITFLPLPIALSQTPPKCDDFGGLTTQTFLVPGLIHSRSYLP